MKIRVKSLNKLLVVYDQVQRYGLGFPAREIAALISCTVAHAYNYKYGIEELICEERSQDNAETIEDSE